MKFFSFSAVLLLLAVAAFAGDKSPSLQNKLDKIFSAFAPDQPGLAVLVRQNGRTIYQRGFGMRDLQSRAPITPQTDFRLASCTKQFTAMAIMLLVHDGKLRYDTRLTDVFPDFPEYGKAITIRHLLNHSSGLPDYEALIEQSPTRWSEAQQITDAEVLALLKSQTHGKFAPGSSWSYSNSGYVVLGLIVAQVSGQSFPDFLQARIFAPLKMNHTLAYVRGTNVVPNRAYGHSQEGNKFIQTDQSSTSATLGDGGVYSNLEDLARWGDALTHHTLLSEAEMQPALVPFKLPDGSLPHWASDPGDTDPLGGKPVAYGFGWFLDSYQGHPRMWHYGDTVGFKSAIERFPQDRLTVIVLCNRSDLDAPALALKVADAVLTSR